MTVKQPGFRDACALGERHDTTALTATIPVGMPHVLAPSWLVRGAHRRAYVMQVEQQFPPCLSRRNHPG